MANTFSTGEASAYHAPSVTHQTHPLSQVRQFSGNSSAELTGDNVILRPLPQPQILSVSCPFDVHMMTGMFLVFSSRVIVRVTGSRSGPA